MGGGAQAGNSELGQGGPALSWFLTFLQKMAASRKLFEGNTQSPPGVVQRRLHLGPTQGFPHLTLLGTQWLRMGPDLGTASLLDRWPARNVKVPAAPDELCLQTQHHPNLAADAGADLISVTTGASDASAEDEDGNCSKVHWTLGPKGQG